MNTYPELKTLELSSRPNPFSLQREWRALWIQPSLQSQAFQPRDHVKERCLFREEFYLNKIDGLTLYVKAGSYYELYINGQRVATDSSADQSSLKSHEEIDVTSYLKSGENCFALVLQRHFYEPSGLLLELLDTDGELVLWTDSAWRTTAYDMFNDEWQFCGFDDTAWALASS